MSCFRAKETTFPVGVAQPMVKISLLSSIKSKSLDNIINSGGVGETKRLFA